MHPPWRNESVFGNIPFSLLLYVLTYNPPKPENCFYQRTMADVHGDFLWRLTAPYAVICPYFLEGRVKARKSFFRFSTCFSFLNAVRQILRILTSSKASPKSAKHSGYNRWMVVPLLLQSGNLRFGILLLLWSCAWILFSGDVVSSVLSELKIPL